MILVMSKDFNELIMTILRLEYGESNFESAKGCNFYLHYHSKIVVEFVLGHFI